LYIEFRKPFEAQNFLKGFDATAQNTAVSSKRKIGPNELLTLIKTTLILRNDFCSLTKEFLAEGDQRYREAIADFEGFMQICSDEAVGLNLAAGRVPQSTFWLVRDGQRILGCSRLRHSLSAFLEELGGHIGYDVRPSERRRGYGTLLLSRTIDEARELGLARVLITADSSNLPSWQIIEKNGGLLHSEALSNTRANFYANTGSSCRSLLTTDVATRIVLVNSLTQNERINSNVEFT
jgi:predicted acetyltransferase